MINALHVKTSAIPHTQLQELEEAGAVFAIEDGVLCQLLRCCIRTDMHDKPRNSIENFSRRCFRRVCLLCFRKCTQNAAEEHLPCRG